MTQVLRQSTAVDVLIGPFVDSTDGFTGEVGVSPAVKLSKNGQALAAKNDVTTPVHDADGYYNCELDTTDTNTVGTMVLSVVGSSTSLPVRHEFQVIEEAVYDRDYAASASGLVTLAAVTHTGAVIPTVSTLTGHTAQTGDSFARIGATGSGLTSLAQASLVTAARMGALTDWIDGGRLDLLLDAIPTTPMRGTDNAALASLVTAARMGALDDWIDGGRLDLLLDAIPTTAMRGTDGANTTAPDNAGIADIQSRLPAALVNSRMDASVDGTGMEAAAAQVVADLIIPKTNTALSNIEFLMVDETDFTTPETGLTVAGTRSIDGGAFGAVTGVIAEVANGIYQLDASQADMNGSIITFRFTSTGAADRFLTIRTSG